MRSTHGHVHRDACTLSCFAPFSVSAPLPADLHLMLWLVGFWCWHLLARGACVSAPSFRRGAATGRFRGFCGSRLELPSRDGPFGPRFRTRPRQFAAARQQMQVSQLTEPFRFSLFHRYPSACIQNTMRDTETEALHNLRTPSLGPVFH